MKTRLLLESSDEKLYEIFQPTKCANCDTRLHESKTGMRKIADGQCLCSSCYFERIGELIDESPIGLPGRHR